MQAIRVKSGDVIDYTPSGDVGVGDVVVQETLVGVALRDLAANVLGDLCVKGVFKFEAVGEVMAAGAVVYWDADGTPYGGSTTGAVTTTSTNNSFVGFNLFAVGATDGVAYVWMYPPASITNTVHNAITAAITDPGDAGAIPVTDSGYCNLVTEGAEDRTLADATYVGQLLLLGFKTDGGDCTITAASPVNQAGNNTMIMADVGDSLLLVGSPDGADIEWRVVANDGVALSTV